MIRAARIGLPLATLALAGCADLAGGSYVLDPGAATYDALKAATEQCQAKGGALRPRKDYGGQNLSDYQCAIGQAR